MIGSNLSNLRKWMVGCYRITGSKGLIEISPFISIVQKVSRTQIKNHKGSLRKARTNIKAPTD